MTNIVPSNVSSLLDSWIVEEQKGNKFPVPFDIAWGIAGYSRKDNAKRSGLKALKEGREFSSELRNNAVTGRPSELIMLSIDGMKHLCLMSQAEEGWQVRQYFIESEKELRQLKANREFPNQITGNISVNPVVEFADTVRGVVDAIFVDLEPEFRTGIVIEGICKKHPELRETLEPHKPKLLLDAPLLTPTEIGLKLEQKDGIKRSAIAVNRLLIERGFQVKTGDKKLAYRAIGQGIEFSKVVADTASGHGKTITSLRWYESVCEQINS